MYSLARYGDSFTFLYVDDVRTSQEAGASTVRYGDRCAVIGGSSFCGWRLR
jgi:hypothetical protein